ncbi:zinc finger BED domain-containing protein 1-like [Rhagoletis pomonella]|uniref:zinc finger BED domain-containing protein 1-like n=1 Tax=Rhagoletis pomonella TaxID=28610 RepID=UPI00177B9462|nr:zinc finger BED domain-containing protein 1-like [Rhagoletis pomonella]
MDKKSSRMWNFFTPVNDGKAKCDIYTTTVVQEDPVPLTSSDTTTVVQEDPAPPTSSDIQIGNTPTNETRSKQTKLSAFIERPPFSVVEDTGFKDLLTYLEPGYKIPSRYILSNTLLDAHYSDAQKRLKEELQSVKHISITTEGWTSRATTSYQAVTAHYLLNWELKSALLGCFECHERHTAEYIKNELCNLLSYWEIQSKIFVCVTDNAANMKAAIRLGKIEHLPYVAHTLNLVVRAGLQDSEIERLIKKIKAIVEHFHRSPVATKKLITIQEQMRPNQTLLKLKMDVVTRWNSTLDMIERICLLQEPLEAALGILHNPVENLSESEWKSLPDIIKVLKPFKQLTEEISSENKVIVSIVLAATEEIAKKLLSKVIMEFKMRFKNCHRHPLLSKAALLDPRFKKLAFTFDLSSYESAKDALKTELECNFNFHKEQSGNINKPTSAIDTDGLSAVEGSIWKDFDAIAESNSVSNSTVTNITNKINIEFQSENREFMR